MHPKEPVKFFVKDEGVWTDVKTGYLSFEKDAMISEKARLLVKSTDDELVLASHVKPLERYEMDKKNSLMKWKEGDNGPEVCISFLESVNRARCANVIKKLQEELEPQSSSKSVEVAYTYLVPTVDNLMNIEGTIRCKSSTRSMKAELMSHLRKVNFVTKLKVLYLEIKERDDQVNLKNLYNVVMALLNLYDASILEALLSDDLVETTMSILENDSISRYKDYVEDSNHFHHKLNFNSLTLMQSISLSFRLNCLKKLFYRQGFIPKLDSVLKEMIDNKKDIIVNTFNLDTQHLSSLVKMLENDTFSISTKREVLRFIKHICLVNNHENHHMKRKSTVDFLAKFGIKTMLKFSQKDFEASQNVVCGIMLLVVNQSIGLVRMAIMNDALNDDHILKLLTEIITKDSKGLRAQGCAEFIKKLLFNLNPLAITKPSVSNKSNVMNLKDADLEEFVEFFYAHFANYLLIPLLKLSVDNFEVTEDDVKIYRLSQDLQSTCFTVCELLIAFLRSHPDVTQTLPNLDTLISKVKLLIHSPKSSIQLVAVRVFRTMLGTKCPTVLDKLINHSVLKELIVVYRHTFQIRNALNSAVLEFMEFVRAKNLKKVVNHIYDDLQTDLVGIEDTNAFKQLIKLKQSNDDAFPATPSIENGYNRSEDLASPIPITIKEKDNKVWGTSTLDKDEELYFSEKDDMEELDVELDPQHELLTYDGLGKITQPQNQLNTEADSDFKPISLIKATDTTCKLDAKSLDQVQPPSLPLPSNNSSPPKRRLLDDEDDGFAKFFKAE